MSRINSPATPIRRAISSTIRALAALALALSPSACTPSAGGGGGGSGDDDNGNNNGNENNNGNGDPEPIFPADYRTTFSEVRNCRDSIEHGGVAVRVYVNAIGAEAYLAEENPLPVGTIVVKEEFDGVDCSNDDELAIWSVMAKQEEGFDPEAADWRYQEAASPSRNVTINSKTTCIECHSAEECLLRDYMCTEE
jgi:hypothetical protein